MKKNVGKARPLALGWEDIGFICEGMSFASQPLLLATEAITEEYSLGPRGAWMVRLISGGNVYPLDMTRVFRCGRSLITAELNRLVEAGLVSYRQSAADGRRVELALTAEGEKVSQRVKKELSRLVLQRLAGYTREEVLLCARMLRDFRQSASPVTESRDAS